MGPETQVLRQASAAEPKGYPACGNYITQTPFGQWVQRIKTESESGPLNWDACFDNNCTVYACIHKPQPQLNTVNTDTVYRNIMRWQNLTQFVISHSYLIRDVVIATNWFRSLKLVSLSTSTVPDTHAQQRGRNLSAVHVVFLFCFFSTKSNMFAIIGIPETKSQLMSPFYQWSLCWWVANREQDTRLLSICCTGSRWKQKGNSWGGGLFSLPHSCYQEEHIHTHFFWNNDEEKECEHCMFTWHYI